MSTRPGLDLLDGDDGRQTRRLVPPDWPFALRAGIESVLSGWLLVVIPSLAVFAATSSRDAAAALSLGGAARTGTGLWSLGLGGSMGQADSADGVLGLPLLGLTCLQVLLTRWFVRRARLSGVLAGVWTVLAALATAALLVAASGPAGSRTWPAVLGVGLLTALVTLRHLHSRGRGWRLLSQWWAVRPVWADAAVSLVRGTALALGFLVALVAVAAVLTGAGRVSRLHDSLSSGGIIPVLGLVLIQLGWVPTMAVWALAWIAGPGFAVGTGSVFAPDLVIAGAVPSLPLLGLLPSSPVGTPGVYLPLLVTVATMLAAWRARRGLQHLTIGQTLVAALAASLAVAVGALALGWAASGPVGPGRMAHVGPGLLSMTLLISLEVGVGLLSVAALSHPYARELTGRGITATTEAADAAAHGTRERVETRVEAARERLAGAREARHAARRTQDASSSASSGTSADPSTWAPEEPGPPTGPQPFGDTLAGWRDRTKAPRDTEQED